MNMHKEKKRPKRAVDIEKAEQREVNSFDGI
ncbi:hypothetical protein B23_0216 [Geobacillus thermoleovorans B23]|nr:hypothetical protein B23_0216 [Geobacillus thermoleovorans B23]